MKRRARIVVLLFFLVAAAGLYCGMREKEFIFQGKPVSRWALDLNTPEKTTRDQAERAIKEMGAQAVPSLIRMLGSRDPWYMQPLLAVALKLKGKFQPLLFQIFKPLEAHRKRHSAAMALQILGPTAQPAIPALGKTLRDDELGISWIAGDALARIGEPAVPELVAALDLNKPFLFSRVCDALAKAGPDAVAAIPALVQKVIALETESGNMPPPSSNATARAASRQSAPPPPPGNLGSQVARTLGKIGPPALPSLGKLLQHTNSFVRQRAAQALAGMGPRGRLAIPALRERLKDESAAVRAGAVQALGQIRPWDPQVVAGFIPLLKDADEEVRLAAVLALDGTPRTNESVQSALREALQDENGAVRREAATWLKDAASPDSSAKE